MRQHETEEAIFTLAPAWMRPWPSIDGYVEAEATSQLVGSNPAAQTKVGNYVGSLSQP